VKEVQKAAPRATLPSSLVVRALAAPPVDEAALRAAIDAIARPMLRKGVAPMLHGLLAAVGVDQLPLLETMARDYIAALRDTQRFDDASDEEPPATLFWALYMHARIAYERADYAETLRRLDAAHRHTPTAIDVASLRAKTYKRAGDAAAAFAAAEVAREMDLADRYLNNKAGKLAMRAGQRGEAVRLLHLFTKSPDGAEAYMHDLQTSWFEIEAGESALNAGEFGHALHYFRWVDKFHDDMAQERLDFCAFSLRRVCVIGV
jgi:tetratricopeptide (TPR) repeat protein